MKADDHFTQAALGLRFLPGAGDGNRTRMTSLEGWSSTIELRPQQPPNGAADTGSVPSPAPIAVVNASRRVSPSSQDAITIAAGLASAATSR